MPQSRRHSCSCAWHPVRIQHAPFAPKDGYEAAIRSLPGTLARRSVRLYARRAICLSGQSNSALSSRFVLHRICSPSWLPELGTWVTNDRLSIPLPIITTTPDASLLRVHPSQASSEVRDQTSQTPPMASSSVLGKVNVSRRYVARVVLCPRLLIYMAYGFIPCVYDPSMLAVYSLRCHCSFSLAAIVRPYSSAAYGSGWRCRSIMQPHIYTAVNPPSKSIRCRLHMDSALPFRARCSLLRRQSCSAIGRGWSCVRLQHWTLVIDLAARICLRSLLVRNVESSSCRVLEIDHDDCQCLPMIKHRSNCTRRHTAHSERCLTIQ
nr:hypothetical protein CFP56_11711 [Quercus suber]